ncbi:MAG TPA: hypothetical protein VKF36_16065 [Syntrophorhabdales bacterium]|nr:hypothetical protein [Syntrophorhabdales bacterium]
MNTGKLIAGVALVFIVGILVGSVGMSLYIKHHYRHFMPERGNRTAFIMKRLSKDLSLTQTQEAAIKKIVEKTEEKVREHFLQRRSEMTAIIDDGFSQMRKELDDAQKKKLDELREKFERRRQAREERDFHRPPPKPE